MSLSRNEERSSGEFNPESRATALSTNSRKSGTRNWCSFRITFALPRTYETYREFTNAKISIQDIFLSYGMFAI